MHHQVVIIGAGPSGLLLARLLLNRGIDCIILENRNEAFLRRQNRGGFLAYTIHQLLIEEKVSSSLPTKAIPLTQIDFQINKEKHSLSLTADGSEKYAVIYDQRNLVADLLEGVKAAKQAIIFEAKGQRYEGIAGDKVKIVYTLHGQIYDMTCDFVVGCDGYRGISRRSIPKAQRVEQKEELPYAWLEWIVEKEATIQHPIIAFSKDGFAMQTPSVNGQTRYYLQVKRGIEMDDLPTEEEIWEVFENRLNHAVARGTLLQKKLDYMRTFYTDTMQYGRLFIAGDAAHQVPRFGSKGMNMALADAAKLATAFYQYFKNNDSQFLNNYTQDCLRENLKIITYTNYLNQLFHKNEDTDFTTQANQIKTLLTDDNQKSPLLDYLIG